MKFIQSITALTLVALSAASTVEAAGRYTMHPAEHGGFVRLDTQTGAMSLCRRDAKQWICQPMGENETKLSSEISQLREENKKLKAELRQLEGFVFPDGKNGDKSGRPHGNIELPSEQDLDKMMSYFSNMFRKFKEKLKEFEDENKKSGSTPKPPTTPL